MKKEACMESAELIESKVFRSKRLFKEGMEEIRHFNPPCEYEYRFYETQLGFPRSSNRIGYGVEIYRRETPVKEFCQNCEFYNCGECDRDEE